MSSLPDHTWIILEAAPPCTIPSQPGQQWDQYYMDLCYEAGNILRMLHWELVYLIVVPAGGGEQVW